MLLTSFNLILGLGLGWLGLEFSGIEQAGLMTAALSLVAMIIMRAGTNIFADKLSIHIFSQARAHIANIVFGSMGKKLRKFPKAEILDRLTTDTYNLIDAFSSSLVQWVSHLLILICALGFTYNQAPRGLLVIALGVLVYLGISILIKSRIQSKTQKMRECETRVFIMEKNFVDGYEYLQSSGYFKTYYDKFLSSLSLWEENEKSRVAVLNFSDTASWAVKISFILLLASSVAQNMGIETIYFYWIFIAISSLSQLSQSMSHLYQLVPQYKRSQELLDEIQGSQREGAIGLEPKLRLVAKDLCLSFDPQKKSNIDLGPINFLLTPGDFLFLKGQSGSGKTSLLRTIMGFNDSYSGELRLPDKTWKRAYVEQEPFFFEGESLRINLGLSENNEVPEALITGLGLTTFFQRLPDGLNTVIGTESFLPSKGQARRLAILRALMHQPQVLVLDEPTAGIDDSAALSVVQTLRAYCEHTILIVADHRADLILSGRPTQCLDLDLKILAGHAPTASV